jgi:hypothetical protein
MSNSLDTLFAMAEQAVERYPFCGHSPTHDATPCSSPNISHLIVVTGEFLLAVGGLCQACADCQHPDHADDALKIAMRPYTVKAS